MASPWDPADSEAGDGPGTEGFTSARRPVVGLEASELELLRSAPDFDAEEMSTVRPPGGWPTPAPPPAAGFKPAAAVWSPPNQVDPPSALTPPGQRAEAAAPAAAPPAPQTEGLASEAPAQPAEPTPAPWRPPNRVEPPAAAWSPAARVGAPVGGARIGPDASHNRFPEERTVALLAEDLLGRPLDELPPAPAVEEQPEEQGMRWAPVREEALPDRPRAVQTTADINVWDQAMPLVNEG
jgi:hypothetical protein